MRSYPSQPRVGVGAVIVDGERVLLVKRGHPPLKGEWSLPGGGVELGESLEVAFRREMREETGLEVEVGPVVEVFDRVHLDADGRVEYHYVVIDYLCRVRSGTATPGSDVEDARWVDVVDLAEYRLTPAATAVIGKALAIARQTDRSKMPAQWS